MTKRKKTPWLPRKGYRVEVHIQPPTCRECGVAHRDPATGRKIGISERKGFTIVMFIACVLLLIVVLAYF